MCSQGHPVDLITEPLSPESQRVKSLHEQLVHRGGHCSFLPLITSEVHLLSTPACY